MLSNFQLYFNLVKPNSYNWPTRFCGRLTLSSPFTIVENNNLCGYNIIGNDVIPKILICYEDTNLPLVVSITNSEVWHRPKNGHQGLDRIAVDHRSILLVVLRRKAAFVDNSGTKLNLLSFWLLASRRRRIVKNL